MNQDKLYLLEIIKSVQSLTESLDFYENIQLIASLINKANSEDKLTVIFGNGGSAADAQHFSAELIGTYCKKNRKPYKSLALTTDSSFLTAWSNDFEYQSVFQRQIKALSNTIGLSIGLSTSGKSINVINALKESYKNDIKSILISGINCPDYDFVNHIIRLPSNDTSIIQTLTQIKYHLICQQFEKG